MPLLSTGTPDEDEVEEEAMNGGAEIKIHDCSVLLKVERNLHDRLQGALYNINKKHYKFILR